jgi:sulfur dioxygenase
MGGIMIFRQLFDSVSCTYTYLLGGRAGGEAIIIDPVFEKVDRYISLLKELELRLVKTVETHVHADHITGGGALRDQTGCVTVMGKNADVDVVSMRVDDGDVIEIDNVRLGVLYTPGHTNDSYCFKMPGRVFTGDTLLIRGTGRTDFQHGDSRAGYESIFNKLLTLPDETLVFPGHNYKGDTVSSIAEERAFNPRLQVSSADEYAEIMDNLNLPNPKLMDVAVPANLKIGLAQDNPEIKGCTLAADILIKAVGTGEKLFVDLREDSERAQYGVIPDSVHIPYNHLENYLKPGGLLSVLAQRKDQELVLYCAYGERSALALKAMQKAGIGNACHLGGGVDAWSEVGGELTPPP